MQIEFSNTQIKCYIDLNKKKKSDFSMLRISQGLVTPHAVISPYYRKCLIERKKMRRRYGKPLNAEISIALLMDCRGETLFSKQKNRRETLQASTNTNLLQAMACTNIGKTSENKTSEIHNKQPVYYGANQYSVHTP